MSVGTSKKGFTLIELLVVIAIIAILAAILFPVFAAAKAKGQQANCAGNLKQLAIAANAYYGDYGDMDGVASNTDDAWWPFVERRVGATDGTAGYTAGDAHRHSIFKYIKNAGVMICPAARGKVAIDGDIGAGVVVDASKQGKVTYAWHYTYNAGCAGKPDTMKRPSRMPTWVEENTDPSVKNGNGDIAFINDTVFANSDITSCRHNGFCNVAFADGHVQALRGRLAWDKATWPDTDLPIFREPEN